MNLPTDSTPTDTFSVPLHHLQRTDFATDQFVGRSVATGMDQFIGDQSNASLKFLTTDSFYSLLSPSAAAIEVTESADTVIVSNEMMPIVFYGPSGTGKTSVAMSLISQSMLRLENYEDRLKGFSDTVNSDTVKKPILVSGGDFARKFYAALETNSVESFRSQFLQSSAVIIDDLQQLTTKPSAQKELTLLIDSLLNQNVPIIVTCNQLPMLINGIDERLSSRLSAGLCLPFDLPGESARKEIIQQLANLHQLQLTSDAVDRLVTQFDVTVPKIQHLFNQIRLDLRAASLDPNEQPTTGNLVDLDRLNRLLQPAQTDNDKVIRLILQKVAKSFNLKISDLKSNSRKQTVVLARGIAIYLTRELLGISFLKIGRLFGNRDHSTVLHAYRKILSIYQRHRDTEQGSSLAEHSSADFNSVVIIDSIKQQLTDLLATQVCSS